MLGRRTQPNCDVSRGDRVFEHEQQFFEVAARLASEAPPLTHRLVREKAGPEISFRMMRWGGERLEGGQQPERLP